MVKILRKDIKLKYVAKSRPNSLILRIPAAMRDIMEFKHGDDITIEACTENDMKYLKVYKKMD